MLVSERMFRSPKLSFRTVALADLGRLASKLAFVKDSSRPVSCSETSDCELPVCERGRGGGEDVCVRVL